MPMQCCVPECANRTGHTFPWSDAKRVKAWKVAVKGDHWEPTKHSLVCKSHFDENYYEKPQHVYATWQLVTSGLHRNTATCSYSDLTPQDASSQTDRVITETSATQSDPVLFFTASRFAADSKGIHYYTGLENYDKFRLVMHTLGPAACELNYFHGVMPSLSVEDQFFLTLLKLRQHFTNFMLSRLFDIREDAVTNIFVTWINFMACQWGEVNWWPSGDMVHFYSPTDFTQKFHSTRVIIDGIECPIKKPKELVVQQATVSMYKNRNTVKVLVGMSPGGLTTYVSPAYEGSVSNRQICERSSLPQMCDPGDSIMADKGFNVQDLFEGSMVSINIPTFFTKKPDCQGAPC